MTVKQLIRELSTYQQDKEIQIECPNGLLVHPRIKLLPMDDSPIGVFGPIKGYVLAWRD